MMLMTMLETGISKKRKTGLKSSQQLNKLKQVKFISLHFEFYLQKVLIKIFLLTSKTKIGGFWYSKFR